MSEVPLLSSTELVRILATFGFTPVRQTGTHNHLFHPETRRLVTVPSHPVLALGVVLSIFRKADIDAKEFLRLATVH
jgi:predicted RNA binding protein YcfA (HicA-like mRNA interferase family)